PGPVLRLALASRAGWPAWAAAVEEESGIDVEFRTDGIVYAILGAADARVLGARARWQRAAGLRVERLDGRAARRLVPALARVARAALFFPDDHRVNNERLAAAVARAAVRAGARVVEGVEVRAVRARRGRVGGGARAAPGRRGAARLPGARTDDRAPRRSGRPPASGVLAPRIRGAARRRARPRGQHARARGVREAGHGGGRGGHPRRRLRAGPGARRAHGRAGVRGAPAGHAGPPSGPRPRRALSGARLGDGALPERHPPRARDRGRDRRPRDRRPHGAPAPRHGARALRALSRD